MLWFDVECESVAETEIYLLVLLWYYVGNLMDLAPFGATRSVYDKWST